MDQHSLSDPFERQQLIAKIEEAQLFGSECYLREESGELTVRVSPGESPEAAIRQFGLDCNLDVEFSLEPLVSALTVAGCMLNGEGGFDADEFAGLFDSHPIEGIASVQELASLLEDNFGSGSDWRVYAGLLRALPTNLSDDVLERLVVPLLSAGELIWVPDEAEEFLERSGWTAERIRESFSMEERGQRSAQAEFLEDTGVPVSAIETANDLFDAFFSGLNEEGNYRAVGIIKTFIQANHFTTDTDRLERIVFPFASSFGAQGYEDLIEALDNCEHAGSWNMPRFTGKSFSGYAEELNDSE